MVLGTLTYRLLIERTGEVKPSALAMAGFFAAGLLFLLRLNKINKVA